MKRFFSTLGSAGLCLGIAVTGYSQPQMMGTPAPDQKMTPAAMGKGSSLGSIYSPSLFDGSANIGIPIYDFSNSHGSFGISLGFNTKGIKVDDLSSSVSTGWNLNAGGGISRVMKDLPDELRYDATQNSVHARLFGRLLQYSATTAPDPNTDHYDGENDDFVVAAGTLNFTFKLGKDGYIFTHPNRRVRIDLLINDVVVPQHNLPMSTSVYKVNFKITDESGNQYFFEPGMVAEGRLLDGSATPKEIALYEYTSSWVIKKIVFAEGSEITYDYEEIITPDVQLYRNFNYTEYSSAPNYTGNGIGYVQLAEAAKRPQQLTAIHYPNNVTARFVFDQPAQAPGTPCSKSIKEIKIESGDNCTRYHFNKVYRLIDGTETAFDNSCNFAGDPAKRLYLKGIDMLSCDGNLTERYYSFGYAAGGFPSRANPNQDYFGYANGGTYGLLNTIPNHTPIGGGNAYGANREVATNAASIGTGNLTQITNAYGGTVAFEYELHTGLVNVIPNLPGDNLFFGRDANDGVRLKTITETDKFHPGNSRITRYTYEGGQRFLTGGYFHFPLRQSGANAVTHFQFGGYYVTPHQLINGSNHGYSKITVRSEDESGTLLAKSEYAFTNLLDGGNLRYLLNGSSKHYYSLPYTDKQYLRDWEIGLPLQTLEYDADGLLRTKQTNTYNYTLDASSAIGLGTNTKEMRILQGNETNPFKLPMLETDSYLPYTGKALLASSLVEKYISDGSVVTDQVRYEYDGRQNLKKTITRNSRGQEFATVQIYNYELSGSGLGYSPPGTTLYNMTQAGLEKVVGMERWKLNAPGTDSFSRKLADASITEYDYSGGKLRTKSLQVLEKGQLIDYTAYTGLAPGSGAFSPYSRVISAYISGSQSTDFKKTSEVTLFDAKSNPLETKLLNLNSYKAMVWDTATGNKLADVSNARYEEIGFTSFETRQATGSVTDGRFTYDAAAVTAVSGPLISGRTAYALNALGVSPLTIPVPVTGKTYVISFWSKNGAPSVWAAGTGLALQQLATAQGWIYYEGRFTPASATTVSFTSSASIYIDEVRLFPADAMMQSWTYKPLCGATSATDAAGRITYMEFDPLGRPTITRNQEGNILSKTDYIIN